MRFFAFIFSVFLMSTSLQAQITVSFSANTVCPRSLTSLASLSTTGSGNITEYHWDLDFDGQFDDATDSALQVNFDTSATIQVGLQVITDVPDTDFLYVNVSFLPGPQASFTNSTVCARNNTMFQNTSPDGDLFLWNFGDGSSVIQNTPTHPYQMGGTYNVTLVALDTLNLCTDTFIKVVNVYALPSVSIEVLDDTIICEGQGARLVASSLLPHFWSTGENTDTIEFTQQGWVYLVAADSLACIGRDSVFISMVVNPVLSVSEDTALVKGNSIDIMASGADIYVWSTSSAANVGNDDQIQVSPSQNTTYRVVGTNAFGCTAVDSVFIKVYENYWLDYINTITPNGDGKNDKFYIRNEAMLQGTILTIYDAWGNTIFTTASTPKIWDATYQGNPAPADAYYFTLTHSTKSELSFQGTIHVLR